MTAVALVLLVLLAAGSVAAWHPAVTARLDDHPWWVVASVPAAVLGLVAILAAASDEDLSGVAEIAAVVAVVVAVAGGGPVTGAMLRGASQTGIPDITHPTEVGDPTGPAATGSAAAGPAAAGAGGRPRSALPPEQGRSYEQGRPYEQGRAPEQGRPYEHGESPEQAHPYEQGRPFEYGVPPGQAVPPGSSEPARPSDPDPSPATVPNQTGPGPGLGRRQPPPTRPVMRGGAWIGALERGAIAGCLLVGFGEGVLVVLAVKGLGRYPELRAHGAAERFIIGTFASLLWAGSAAGVAILFR